MAKKTEEQMDLLDVGPENAKKIKPVARHYREAMDARIGALEDEVKAKTELLALIKEAKLHPLEDGTIKFRCDGLVITVKPRMNSCASRRRSRRNSGLGDKGFPRRTRRF